MQAGASLSTNPITADAVAEVTSDLFSRGLLERAGAALCWVTPHHAGRLDELVGALAVRLGTRTLAGCVAPGVTVGDREVYDGPGLALMVFSDPDPRRFSVRLARRLEEDPAQAARATVEGTGAGDLIFAMASADRFRASAFLDPLEAMQATLVGGGAVTPGGEDQVFTGEGACGDAVASLRISDCQPVPALTHACKPCSPLLRVTGCVGRLLTELNGRAALEVLREVLHPQGPRRRDPPSGQLMVGLAPTTAGEQLVRGEYLVRPLIGVAPENGALLVGEVLSPGMGLAFVTREAEASRSDLNLMLLEARGQLGDARPAFGIYANCAGRGERFQGIPDYDASVISAYFPEVPLAGFFGGFELGPVQGSPQVHYYTAVMALGC